MFEGQISSFYRESGARRDTISIVSGSGDIRSSGCAGTRGCASLTFSIWFLGLPGRFRPTISVNLTVDSRWSFNFGRLLFLLRRADWAGEKLASYQDFDHVDNEDLLEDPDLQLNTLIMELANMDVQSNNFYTLFHPEKYLLKFILIFLLVFII